MRLVGLLLLLPSPLHACAVCFGQSDNAGLLSGLSWGLFVLLGSTFFLIGGIALAVLRIEKNRAAREAQAHAAHP